MEVKIKMPDLATTDTDIFVTQWLIEVGQRVKRGDSLLEVETDKAVMEVESIATGTLKEVLAQPGDAVAVGQVIAVVEAESASGKSTQSDSTASDTSPQDRVGAYDKGFLLQLYQRMVLIRAFEERVKFLFLEGTMPGTIHQCQGQEATAVGVCAALKPEDYITSTFRGHGHALAKGLTIQEVLDELFGAITGCCKGKGGSMHIGDMDKGMVPGIAIVAGGIPLAAGMALAFKMQKTSQVVACFFGDGAVAEGAFHEGVNMAALWSLPVIYVCENNLYGASTRVDKVMKNTRISDRAVSYGFRGETVDGNDVIAVFEAAQRAAEECRADKGPVLLELLTYRRTGHSRRDACHYQSKEERESWFSRDPIERFAERLLLRGDVEETDLDKIKVRIEQEIEDAVEAARAAPQPTVEDLVTDVVA